MAATLVVMNTSPASTSTSHADPEPSAHEDSLRARPTRYTGGCHCGRVRYEVELDLSKGTGKCNCTICTKTATWGAIVAPSAFRLLSGEDSLSDYQFNTRSVHHLFCTHCGVRSFGRGHIAQIGGDFVSVNVRCLDDVDLAGVAVRRLDGRHDAW